jgi:hypothetical protein
VSAFPDSGFQKARWGEIAGRLREVNRPVRVGEQRAAGSAGVRSDVRRAVNDT